MKRYSILFISKAISIGVAKIKSTDNIGKVVRKQSLLHIIVTTIVLEGNYTVLITIVVHICTLCLSNSTPITHKYAKYIYLNICMDIYFICNVHVYVWKEIYMHVGVYIYIYIYIL